MLGQRRSNYFALEKLRMVVVATTGRSPRGESGHVHCLLFQTVGIKR